MRLGDAASYDVHVWGIHVYRGKRGTTYTVKWLTESFRAGLITAARGGDSSSPPTDFQRPCAPT
jgi:hypothetical protein